MIINKIAVCDFRSYSGLHEVELAPRMRYGAERPIVLFGGLNGAGKTTLLLAVKLALYGRHALGLSTTKAAYEEFVTGCIHRSNYALVKPNSAYVEVVFSYGKLGQRLEYRVRRSWLQDGNNIRETIKIWSSEQELVDLTQEECQGFLNELIPVGVSELFFFDGEKIAELAEDTNGSALGDAIRRLLGLDLVEKLRNDLRVYSLRRETSRADKPGMATLEQAKSEYDLFRTQIGADRQALAQLQDERQRIETERDLVESRLLERGGSWGTSRQAQQARATELAESSKKQSRELRDILGGIYPLALAQDSLGAALKDARSSVEHRKELELQTALRGFAKSLKKELDADGKKAVDKALKKIRTVGEDVAPLIDLTSRELAEIEYAVADRIPAAVKETTLRDERLASLEHDLDMISVQIDRAPDERVLVEEFEQLATINDQLAEVKGEIAVRVRELKLAYHRAIESARSLRRLHEAITDRREMEQPLGYASRARALLKDFAQISAERKVLQLETEFADAFRRLARKEDILVRAEIDPHVFSVKLIDQEGGVVDKTQLSAGEKQIYAIAMLEALARTSGRKLPVIIDTPLGRLDSKHRKNLVEEYFPRASHQVILLSTDTEVDEQFYKALSPNISRVYEIVFDEEEKASTFKEGYFWRQAAYKEAV